MLYGRSLSRLFQSSMSCLVFSLVFFTGSNGGLTILLDAQQYEYTNRDVVSAGFHVLVHDQAESNQYVLHKSVSVGYSSEVDIAISLTNVSQALKDAMFST